MPNRLAHESSPYLRQHANNPVDWWPWGPEAIAQARRRDVPIFLSIGYSTCYWCHVMERESFEDEATARLMNEHFVCVKLDREERPDVDEAYMAATVMMSGHGGWPMSVFLEPQGLRPFFCGTYFPAEPRPGMPTFTKVLEAMAGAWRTQREGVQSQATQIGEVVAQHLGQAPPPVELGQAHVADAVGHLLRMFDRSHGGFGPAPKFPQVVFLEFLMDVRDRAADDSTADAIDIAVKKTLDHMAVGGLHDHVGGGFHRYSVDDGWTVPHFEKMLYDQAQMLNIYARAAARYADAFYARTARRVAGFVLREMTDPAGGFHSAQDAEVDGREGLNYLWTPRDLAAAGLGPDEALARRAFGLDGPPNFRDPHHPDEPARHVPRLADRPERVAPAFELPPARFLERLDSACEAMRRARDARPRPGQDDKALAAWNGMMIAALARASRDLDEPAYLAAAERAADFVLSSMMSGDDLRRSWRAGAAGPEGVLEDSAWMITALVALADHGPAARREARLREAETLARRAWSRFGDGRGALFDTPADRTDLFVRARSTHDGATPCGVSAMIHALLDLAAATGRREHTTDALAALASISGRIAESPVGCVNSVRALFRLLVASEVAPGPPAATAPAHAPTPGHVVHILAEHDRVVVTPDAPAVLHLAMDVAPGWHVAAAEPGTSPAAGRLTPFRVDVTGGGGVRAFADYPPGVPFGTGDASIRVYHGRVEIKVALERHGEWKGRPLLAVRYQACSDRECLAPTTAELDIAIDRGG